MPQELTAAQGQLRQGQHSVLGPERLFPKVAPQLRPAHHRPYMAATGTLAAEHVAWRRGWSRGKGDVPQHKTPFDLPAVGWKAQQPAGRKQ